LGGFVLLAKALNAYGRTLISLRLQLKHKASRLDFASLASKALNAYGRTL
jgi:hypothetical protein